jgi:hypothetical protein
LVRKSFATAWRNAIGWLLDVPVSCESALTSVPSGAETSLSRVVSFVSTDVPIDAVGPIWSKDLLGTRERTVYCSAGLSVCAGTIMPLSGSMLTPTPVTRCARSRYGIHGTLVSGPSSIVYVWVTSPVAGRMEGSASAGITPPDGRNVRSNDHPSPS